LLRFARNDGARQFDRKPLSRREGDSGAFFVGGRLTKSPMGERTLTRAALIKGVKAEAAP
jgi:hypothetical protein